MAAEALGLIASGSPERRAARLCLIVHDDMDLRLRLAALLRRALPSVNSNGLDRLLAKEPDGRYASAGEFLAGLYPVISTGALDS